eukprot:COSAG01_NODE_1449_length_10271_cov_6.347976_6_plen_110_part_00
MQVDGFISSVAALCAAHMEPPCRDAMVLATASAEAGGALVSSTLGGAKPALDMGLRLGEGSGAALVLVRRLLRSQARVVHKADLTGISWRGACSCLHGMIEQRPCWVSR